MIISVSRRTDIPRFYAEWFMHRLRAGFCLVPNPFNPRQVSRVDLRAQSVTAIVFWTRYPEPLLRYLDEIEEKGFHYYFQFTLNNYPAQYEKNAARLDLVLRVFEKLACQIGRSRVIWRYDPIFFADGMDELFHLRNLAMLCQKLTDCTDQLVISLVDEYRKILHKFREMDCHYQGDPLQTENLRSFLEQVVSTAHQHHMTVSSCAEPLNIADLGVAPGRCIDHVLINKMCGTSLEYKKDPSQRKLCGCMVSKDIGMNQTCPGGCVYCYAGNRHDTVLHNFQHHDPHGESLV
jgi:hypothetical protein